MIFDVAHCERGIVRGWLETNCRGRWDYNPKWLLVELTDQRDMTLFLLFCEGATEAEPELAKFI